MEQAATLCFNGFKQQCCFPDMIIDVNHVLQLNRRIFVSLK